LSIINNDFLELLINLSKFKHDNFTGTGLLLYENLRVVTKYHSNLVDNTLIAPALRLGSKKLFHYLSEISNYNHPCHDGFHFINQEGQLTHVAQFLSPPISNNISNVQGHGARTLCSIHASNIPGVVTVGTVSSSGHVYLYKNGGIITPV